MDLERFYGEAHLVDLAPGAALPPETPLTLEIFTRHEALFQPAVKIVYRTGWNRMFGRPEFFSKLPTLTLEAARRIASRGVSLLGMDTPTPSADWLECRHILLGKEVELIIVEGLANLYLLPPIFTFIGFPLNIKGRDGSPIRAVGLVRRQCCYGFGAPAKQFAGANVVRQRPEARAYRAARTCCSTQG